MIVNGREITLYYPKGEIIPCIEEFIDYYSTCYYLYNNKAVEGSIETIFKNGIQSPVELFRVLVWKLGKINMKKSTESSFKYYEKIDEEDMQLRLYTKDDIINRSDIDSIYKIIGEYSGNCNSDKTAQDFLNEIKAVTDKYFYPVYMITLLYFVSKGKYPIVDSFSYVALNAIYNNYELGTRKSYPGLARRSTSAFDNILTQGTYAQYKKRLRELFNEKAESRTVDQALWTYGKLFKN